MRTFKSTQQDMQARIVREVRRGFITSRVALAEEVEIAPSTMGIHVDELVQRGFLVESGKSRGATGRPKRLLKLVPGAGWFAGVEFTGGRLQAVRLDFAGGVVETVVDVLPERLNAAEMIERIALAVNRLRDGAEGPLLGTGIGSPGLVDPQKGSVVYSQFQPDWQNVPLARLLTRELKTRVLVENNLHVITLAERWFGEGRDEKDFGIVRARLGFGLGVVKDGRLLSGAHHAAGEIGMLPWPLERGDKQVHDVLSAVRVWKDLSGSHANAPEDLREALSTLPIKDDKAWRAVVTDYARVLGMVQLMIDARVFFLHGPLTALGERFCVAVMERSAECIPALKHSPLLLRLTKLGREAGALGAASLAMESWNPEDVSL
jgi:predicted NBD/HSP70 family sugar kinase